MDYPKYKKVNKHTIKIIVEKANDVPLTKILANKQILLQEKANIEKTLKGIEDILENAKKLGIIPEPKDKNINK